MFPDFKDLLSALNAHRVRYLIVGGYAVGFHAQPRATRDLDILIGSDAANGRALYAALAQFGAPLQGLTAQDLVEPGSFFRMGTPPVMVDILSRIGGVDFNEAWLRRVDVDLDGLLTVPFISREDLLAAKLAAGRPQDLADVAALETDKPHGAAHQPAITAEDPEVTRARAREDWLKLREQQQAGRSPTEDGESPPQDKRAEDRDAGIDEDDLPT